MSFCCFVVTGTAAVLVAAASGVLAKSVERPGGDTLFARIFLIWHVFMGVSTSFTFSGFIIVSEVASV